MAQIHMRSNGRLFSQNIELYLCYPIMKRASPQPQRFLVLHIGYSGYRAVTSAHNRTIDSLVTQKHTTDIEKYWFQNNQDCNLQTMQKVIIGCWKYNFDKIVLWNSKNKTIIWIYTLTRWTTCWQPARFRRVMRCPSSRTRIHGSGVLTTRTTNLKWGRFRPEPGPEALVQNRCYHYRCMISKSKEHLQLLCAIDELCVPAFVGHDEMGDGVDDIDTMFDSYSLIA